jgi:hypothetical protein
MAAKDEKYVDEEEEVDNIEVDEPADDDVLVSNVRTRKTAIRKSIFLQTAKRSKASTW